MAVLLVALMLRDSSINALMMCGSCSTKYMEEAPSLIVLCGDDGWMATSAH